MGQGAGALDRASECPRVESERASGGAEGNQRGTVYEDHQLTQCGNAAFHPVLERLQGAGEKVAKSARHDVVLLEDRMTILGRHDRRGVGGKMKIFAPVVQKTLYAGESAYAGESTTMPDDMIDPIAQEILDFWFTPMGSPEYGEHREIWFRGGSPEFDQEIGERFLTAHEQAASGALGDWKATAEGYLALTITLDQFPRNMFRRSPRAFATDALALRAAKHAVAQGFDLALPQGLRGFFYLPYEHSENLEDQEAGVALMPRTGRERSVKAAKEHLDIIAAYGRFPHRNEILGRKSTPEEIAYMADGGKSFGQGSKPDPSVEDD